MRGSSSNVSKGSEKRVKEERYGKERLEHEKMTKMEERLVGGGKI